MPEFVDEVILESKRVDWSKAPASFQTKRNGWFKAYPPLDSQMKKHVRRIFTTRPGTNGPDTLVGFKELSDESYSGTPSKVQGAEFEPFFKEATRIVIENRPKETKGYDYLGDVAPTIFKVAYTLYRAWLDQGRPKTSINSD